MANVKINDLALAAAVTGAMQWETDTGGVTSEKVNTPQLVTYFNNNLTFGSWTTQIYAAGVDYTAGVTNSLALPVDAVVEANLLVFFDGTVQLEDMWSITTGGSPSVDFSSPIPSGVTKVGVRVWHRP